ncbi:MAG: hypothetical protein EOP58_10170 [Sphingomonadales bacterium]|nr:MAG: hypothetical protein EOP58_10170 [Sphingomonadales bacterium]
MTRTFSASAPEAHGSVYRVEAPQASSAVGMALRCAFDQESGLPEDMVRLLRQLNRTVTQRAH